MANMLVGSSAERVDGRLKVTGQAIYGADRVLPRMVHAVPVPATIGKGRIAKIDTSAAERTRGVVLVLTHLNMDRLKPDRFSFAGGRSIQSFLPLQSADIAYRGQPIALVVAESLEVATAAASLIRVEYVTEPFSVTLDAPGGESALQAVVAPFFPDFICGDAEKTMTTSTAMVDETFTTPPQHNNPIELLATVAAWDGRQLLIHEGSQASEAIRQGLAQLLALDPQVVRVLSPYTGGGFGQKNALLFHTAMASVASRRLRRPVKLVMPRDQIFHGSAFRATSQHRIRLGVDAGGRLVAGIHEIRAQTSRFDYMPFTGAETTSRMYGIPNFRGVATLVRLDTQTPGFMRAPFEMSSFFALETAMDELAEKIGKDPVDFRIANDTQVDPITGKPHSSRRLNDCLGRGAQTFGWNKRSAKPASMRAADGSLIGWGVACGAYPGYAAPAIASIRLNANGIVDVQVGGHEMGQGVRTAIALVTGDALGVDADHVRITVGDTASPGPQHTTAGSWGTATATPPVQMAAAKVRSQLVGLATGPKGRFAGADSSRITLRSGRLILGGASVSVADVLNAAGLAHLDGQATAPTPGQDPHAMDAALAGQIATNGPVFPDFVTFSYSAHFVEVRIDPRIRRVRVERIVSVIDCGRVVSRRTATSQVYGGLVWGIGAALMERSEVDPRFGGFLNNNIAEYQVPVNGDVRQFNVDFINEPDLRFNAVGAKGLGEISSVGVAGAIANAVYHATGKRVRDLPITIDKLTV
jgi:xanthine dehydrogenase YagR molybdenum-binding subunit